MSLLKIKSSEKEEESIKLFIDFNKADNVLYDDLFLGEYKIVIKIPMGERDNVLGQIKIEYFSLVNNTFLASY